MKKILSILIAMTLMISLFSGVAFAGSSSSGGMIIMRKTEEPAKEPEAEEATPAEATPAEPEAEETTPAEATPVEPEEATEEEAEEVVEETTPVEATEAEAEEVIEETTPAEAEEAVEEATAEEAEEVVEEATAEEAEEAVEETTPVEATEAEAEETTADELIEEVIEVDVRLEGDGMSDIILSVNKDTELTVLAVEGDWVKVQIGEQVGYIYKADAVNMGLIEAEEDNVSGFKVTIFSSRKAVMLPGDIVTLSSVLEGFEGYTVSYQWQYDRGNGFEDIPGATGETYSFALTEETLHYSWSLLVYFE